MRIFSTTPTTYTFSISIPTSKKEVVEGYIFNAINEVVKSSETDLQRFVTTQLGDKIEETALAIKEVLCSYWVDEDFLRCKLISTDSSTAIFGEFELSKYKKQKSPSPLIKDLLQQALNHGIRDTIISLSGGCSK